MSKPFDATTKQMVEAFPESWVVCLGLPAGTVTVMDADVSTVSAEADRVLRVQTKDGGAYIIHIEFQSNLDEDIPARLMRYAVLLYFLYRLPIVSVVILLRRKADSLAFTGSFQVGDPTGGITHDFRYRVLRVWEQTPETFLNAGLGTLPLAPLTKVTRKQLPGIIDAMESRIENQATPAREDQLWVATFILMGLRFDAAFSRRLLEGVQGMKESVTYQSILQEGMAEGRAIGIEEGRTIGIQEGREVGREAGREEGREEEARRLLMRQGIKRFGEPDTALRTRLDAASVEKLEALAERIFEAETWSEFLGA